MKIWTIEKPVLLQAFDTFVANKWGNPISERINIANPRETELSFGFYGTVVEPGQSSACKWQFHFVDINGIIRGRPCGLSRKQRGPCDWVAVDWIPADVVIAITKSL